MEIVKYEEKYFYSIIEIEKESFKDPANKEFYLSEINENPYSNIYLAIEDGKVAGFIDYWITFNSSTICKIAISSEFRRKGFAKKLIDFMVEDLVKNEVETSTLEVRTSNIPAISLYNECGYVKICEKKHYYEDGEDALYMVKGV